VKIAFIVPTEYLVEFSRYNTIELVEAQICYDDPAYLDYFLRRKQAGAYIILDNSPRIKRDITMEQYLDLAYEMRPDEIVAVDVARESAQSIDETMRFMNGVDKFGLRERGVKIMGVVQGRNFEEWALGYQTLDSIIRVDTIGFPRPMPDFPGMEFTVSPMARLLGSRPLTKSRIAAMTRVTLMEALARKRIINRYRAHHLLGLTDGIELKWQRRFDFIRSNDSSSAFWHGAKGIRYVSSGLPVEKEWVDLDFSTKDLSEAQLRDVHWNMQTLTNFATGQAIE